ncbi:MAG: helix-turn-helix domain-containing protein [Pseudomonadota bacterium]
MTSKSAVSVAIVIGDGFPLLSLAFVTEPLRLANRESARPIFSWRVLGVEGARPCSSSGREVSADGPLDDAPADVVLLLSSYGAERMVSAHLTDWLRRRAKTGALMGCVDTGALIFANAGLLSRRPAAAHHEAILGFREARGDAYFADMLYDLDGDRCSSAGGVATFDMSLAIIERYGSPRLARRVTEILNYRPLESGRASGSFGLDWSILRLDRTLAGAVEIMRANIAQPVAIAEIGRRVSAAPWQLRRLFQKYTGHSPQDYYLEVRLDQARNLLRNSGERVGTIALMCGFPALESLSRAYKARFGVSPSKDRALPVANQRSMDRNSTTARA